MNTMNTLDIKTLVIKYGNMDSIYDVTDYNTIDVIEFTRSIKTKFESYTNEISHFVFQESNELFQNENAKRFDCLILDKECIASYKTIYFAYVFENVLNNNSFVVLDKEHHFNTETSKNCKLNKKDINIINELSNGISFFTTDKRKQKFLSRYSCVFKQDNFAIMINVNLRNESSRKMNISKKISVFSALIIKNNFAISCSYQSLYNNIISMKQFEGKEYLLSILTSIVKCCEDITEEDKVNIKRFFGESYFDEIYTTIKDTEQFCVRIRKFIDVVDYKQIFSTKQIPYIYQVKLKNENDIVLQTMLQMKYTLCNPEYSLKYANSEYPNAIFRYDDGICVASSICFDESQFFVKTEYGYINMFDVYYIKFSDEEKNISKFYQAYLRLKEEHKQNIDFLCKLDGKTYSEFYINLVRKGS